MFKFKTDKELTLEVMRENKALKAENIDLKSKLDANLKATRKLVRVDELTNEELLEMVDLYPEWEDVDSLKIGELVQDEGKLYKVVQAHTRQDDWKPEDTPALFDEVLPPGVISEWTQPTGAHDAYMAGDQVIYTDGLTYESTINSNTWSPVDYPQGWKVVNG